MLFASEFFFFSLVHLTLLRFLLAESEKILLNLLSST